MVCNDEQIQAKLQNLILCRLEKVKLSCKYSKCKIAGTLLCVIGALIMSIMHSTISDHFETEPTLVSPSASPSHHHNNSFDEDKIIGCVYLISAILVLSSVVVLQVLFSNNALHIYLCLY